MGKEHYLGEDRDAASSTYSLQRLHQGPAFRDQNEIGV